MKWSWKLAEFRGIGVYMHATFLILIGFVILSHWSAGQSFGKTLEGVVFILALFVCVVLHEFGHALMAAHYGIKTRDITLLPIGGVARLERMPEKPVQELWVALAGPAVNVVIAAGIFLWIRFTDAFVPLEQLSVTGGSFLERMMVVNVILVVFNMLPAFPMDGGRVLRALLATRLEYARATQIAANIGQAMALLFAFLGFFTNPFLIFIGLFVWIGAAQEASMATMKAALGGIPVKRAMMTEFRSLQPGDVLQRAIELVLATPQQDFPVIEDARVVGILPSRELMVALQQRGPDARVEDVMRHDFLSVDANDMLDAALARIRAAECCMTAPVIHHDVLVGLLTAENVREFLLIVSALGERRAQNAAVTS
ncbi:MAG: site-2 protease family protein [Planctomycetia bacterium]|nr:site-2 protease family protein [Planctomycetia bacterium]MCC7313374.1 site-2 protease family protein [Planctomycetota bacterium]OQY96753.1 MAG: site-2 protease family protein [Planctomycetes bacterium UTPLA1]